jgi:signal transduction histidine kinase
MTGLGEQPATVSRWQARLLPGELLGEAEGRRSARDWVVDVLVVVAAISVGLVGLSEVLPDKSDPATVVDVVIGIAVCLSLWVRRRYPVPIAVLAIVLSAFFATAGGAAVVGVFNVALRGSRRALFAVVALSVVSFVVFSLLHRSVGSIVAQVLFGALVLAVAIGWGLFARARRELVGSLRERAQRLESEQRLRVDQAREAERRRIAREMHDVLGHRISLLSVHAGALEFRPDAPPQEVAEAAKVIRASAQAALEELRGVIGVLRDDGDEPVLRRPQPTLADIPELVEESRTAGMRVEWRGDVTDASAIPAALGRTAYRVVQEGLTNARKHAPAAAVEVTLSPGPPLTVEVVNRAALGSPPADALPGTGTGLVGLAERVALAGGELEHGPDSDGNFVLRATLPWAP